MPTLIPSFFNILIAYTERDYESVREVVELLAKYHATLSNEEMAYYLVKRPQYSSIIIKYAERKIEGKI